MSFLNLIFSKLTGLFGLLESPKSSLSEKADYRRQISALEMQLEKYKAENQYLRSQVEDMQEQLKAIRQELSEARAQNQKLQKTLDQNNELMRQLASKIK